MIHFDNISIGYTSQREEKMVCSGLTASIQEGHLTGLIGDNGVGKSTLIKTLCAYLKPIAGDIFINEHSIKNYSLTQLSKLISIVNTERITGFNLTAFDVVAFGRTPYLNRFSQLNEKDEEMVNLSFEKVGISSLKNKLMEELSDGQRQKVMIAKALAQETPIIILDEPTAFLDYSSKHQLFDILKDLCQTQNKLILVSSHDLDFVFKYCDDILWMKGQYEYEFDTSEKIKSKYKF